MMHLAGQSPHEPYSFVGVVEARAQLSGTATIGPYYMLNAPVSPSGDDGCYLWVHADFEYQSGCRFEPRRCQVVRPSAEALIAIVIAPALSVCVGVGRAPHSLRPPQ
eukprot:3264088-Pyramimonas_sp.AAC.1